jgi:hypothetical protein
MDHTDRSNVTVQLFYKTIHPGARAVLMRDGFNTHDDRAVQLEMSTLIKKGIMVSDALLEKCAALGQR